MYDESLDPAPRLLKVPILASLQVLFLTVLLLTPVDAPSQEEAASEKGPAIVITPHSGVANKFEFVRIYPDRVELRREGIRLNFSRDTVKSARSAEAQQVLGEAAQTLARIEEENLAQFPELLDRIERDLPRVEGIVQRYDWLIPQASETLLEVQRNLFDVRNTLQAVEYLETVAEEVEDMAGGLTPLSATWEEKLGSALAETGRVPYLGIRQDIAERLSKLRREIRIKLAAKTSGSIDRIQKIGSELTAQMRQGTLSEPRWTLRMKEMRRLAEAIPDAKIRDQNERYIDGVERETETAIRLLKEVESYERAESALASLENEIGSLTAGSVDSTSRAFEAARSQVATLPESATRSDLESRLEGLETRFDGSAAALLAVAATPEIIAAAPPVSPAPSEGDGLLSFLPGGIVQNTALGIGAGIGALVLLGLGAGVVARRSGKKKDKGAKDTALPPEPDVASAYDIFNTDEEDEQVSSLSEPSAPVEAPSSAGEEDDIFGFGDESSSVSESDEDLFGAPDSPVAPEKEESPVSSEPSPAESGSDEDDIFGLGDTAADSPVASESVAEEGDPFGHDPAGELEVTAEGDGLDDLFGAETSEATEPSPVSTPEETESPGTAAPAGGGLFDDEMVETTPAPASAEPEPSSTEDDPFGLGGISDEDEAAIMNDLPPMPPSVTEPVEPDPEPEPESDGIVVGSGYRDEPFDSPSSEPAEPVAEPEEISVGSGVEATDPENAAEDESDPFGFDEFFESDESGADKKEEPSTEGGASGSADEEDPFGFNDFFSDTEDK